MTKNSNIKSKYEYASLNRKIIAFGIDVVIITLVLSPIMNLLMMASPEIIFLTLR